MDIARTVRRILDKDREIVYFDEPAPRVKRFVFGEYTREAVLDLLFGCQNSGGCCRSRQNECKELYRENEKSLCKIHDNKDKFPLACAMYPILLDETAAAGIGMHKVGGYNQQKRVLDLDHEYFEFGLMDATASLIIKSSDPAWGHGKPVRNMWVKALNEIIYYRNGRPVTPPLPDLLGIIENYDKGFISISEFPPDIADTAELVSIVFLKSLKRKKLIEEHRKERYKIKRK